jgi:hypothetical protein
LKQAQARAVYLGILLFGFPRSISYTIVFLVSHLFWKKGGDGSFEGQGAVREGKRVLECLQKSLKLADACVIAFQKKCFQFSTIF